MSDEPTPAPTAPDAPPPPTGPTDVQPRPPGYAPAGGEPTYTQDELTAEAASLGVYPWDIAGIFKSKGVTAMTEAEFQAALEEWRTPIPPEGEGA